SDDDHAFRVAAALRPDVGQYFFGNEGFDGVADLHVVEVLNTDTAFVAAGDFGSIFFESLQRCNLAFEDHDVIAQEADFGIACNLPIRNVTAGDSAHLRNPERVSNVGGSEVRFLDNRFEDALHGSF